MKSFHRLLLIFFSFLQIKCSQILHTLHIYLNQCCLFMERAPIGLDGSNRLMLLLHLKGLFNRTLIIYVTHVHASVHCCAAVYMHVYHANRTFDRCRHNTNTCTVYNSIQWFVVIPLPISFCMCLHKSL